MQGSRVLSMLEVALLLNLFCSNTILASMPKLSILGKTGVTTQRHNVASSYDATFYLRDTLPGCWLLLQSQ